MGSQVDLLAKISRRSLATLVLMAGSIFRLFLVFEIKPFQAPTDLASIVYLRALPDHFPDRGRGRGVIGDVKRKLAILPFRTYLAGQGRAVEGPRGATPSRRSAPERQ